MHLWVCDHAPVDIPKHYPWRFVPHDLGILPHRSPSEPFSTIKLTGFLGILLTPLGGMMGPKTGPIPGDLVASGFQILLSRLPGPRSSIPHRATPPPLSQLARFLHWLTSRCSSRPQPSKTFSTPTPVTRTQPLTLSDLRSLR